jgi:hypothetical protein
MLFCVGVKLVPKVEEPSGVERMELVLNHSKMSQTL